MHANRSARFVLALAAAAAPVVGVVGCGSKGTTPQPLTPEAFVAPRAGTIEGEGTATGSGGEVGAGERAVPAVQIPAGPRPQQQPPAGGPKQANPDEPGRPSSDAGAGNDAPKNATAMPPVIGASSGQYMTLGGVVAEVNGAPIFASKVLGLLDESFRVKARQLDAATFRRQAKTDIDNQIRELVRSELEYAAAQRYLTAEDRQMAEMGTMGWRQQQITQAGGSLELARRRAAESGVSFDDQLEERKRYELIRLYYQKKVHPKIQVSADDIRAYYDRNVDQYTQNEKVKFRLLKVDVKKTGDKEKAINKIVAKQKRVKAGEDFKEMVLRENDESMFAKDDMGEMNVKSFAIAKVREAVETLQPGQVSDVIEDGQAFYLVQLVERQGGTVHAFESQKVQDDIRIKLRSEQLRALSEQNRNALLKGAIINATEPMRDIAVEMAMQRYAQYAKAGK